MGGTREPQAEEKFTRSMKIISALATICGLKIDAHRVKLIALSAEEMREQFPDFSDGFQTAAGPAFTLIAFARSLASSRTDHEGRPLTFAYIQTLVDLDPGLLNGAIEKLEDALPKGVLGGGFKAFIQNVKALNPDGPVKLSNVTHYLPDLIKSMMMNKPKTGES